MIMHDFYTSFLKSPTSQNSKRDDEGEEEWDRELESFNSVNAQRRIRDDIAIQNRIHVNPS